MRKLVYGVGVNDLMYKVQEEVRCTITNKRKVIWKCPYYSLWVGMLRRCYNEKERDKFPAYAGVLVCEGWWTFSNFKSWVEVNVTDWSYQLDKDILGTGLLYSPENCVFVHNCVNSFILDSAGGRGEYLIGVSYDKPRNKYRACCRNPFHDRKLSNSTKYLGLFDTEEEAHMVWKKTKHKYACDLADSSYVDDTRVADRLKEIYK